MNKQAVFWDSSAALVPLYVHEITSRQAQLQLRKSMPVVWWGRSVEVHSAIARLHRLGKLNDLDKQGALSRLNLLSRGWREILPAIRSAILRCASWTPTSYELQTPFNLRQP